ncbi:hypothetical protein C8Q79DRAFT_1015307 [Trametes meyenii]|nr:hypothetical protein C8Q79DRAFT_1015307 [Trametes meyenii]
MPHLVRLPIKLFTQILAFLRNDRPTLRSLSLSTRTLHALTYPLLFTVRDFRALSHTHLRPFLIHLSELRVFWRPDMYGDRDAHVFASYLAPHLSTKSIPRLHTLALHGIGTDGMAYLNTLAPTPSAFSALTTLSLTSTYHRHMHDVQSLLSPTTLPHLAHLHLHAVTWFMPDHNDCDRDDVGA